MTRPCRSSSSPRRRAASPLTSLRCSLAAATLACAAAAAAALADSASSQPGSLAVPGSVCRKALQDFPANQSSRISRRPSGGRVQRARARASSCAGRGPAVSGQMSIGTTKRRPARCRESLTQALRRRTRRAHCSLVRPSRKALVHVTVMAHPLGEMEGAILREKSSAGLNFAWRLSSPSPWGRMVSEPKTLWPDEELLLVKPQVRLGSWPRETPSLPRRVFDSQGCRVKEALLPERDTATFWCTMQWGDSAPNIDTSRSEFCPTPTPTLTDVCSLRDEVAAIMSLAAPGPRPP
mmetsp:Transcript_30223/g.66075  ORF Transcript_30223/g.66075 Transcript_30223/m.66075 type:complete len:294 (-) Transcript_30223:127-1008(-)